MVSSVHWTRMRKESVNLNTVELTKMECKQNKSELWDNSQKCNLQGYGIQREEREKWAKQIVEMIKAKNFPN